MTRSSPSKVYSDAMQRSAKKYSKDKERKAKDEVKQQRRIKKYSKITLLKLAKPTADTTVEFHPIK